jgi:glycosyltransferase involved in cell wall biosynthesis
MKLSIITINYNNKAGLQRTIDSVICQTCKDFEWIVIDGGSTDGSKQLIEQYQSHFAYWCSEPDNGVYHAMNKGITHAKGEYLLFLNSGDALYDDNVLQKVDDVHSSADIISGQAVRMDTNELLRHYDKNLLMQLYHDTLNHQATLIKRDLFKDTCYDENLKIVSDWKFWLEAILWKKASVDVVDVIVTKQDMTGISSDQKKEYEERECVLQQLMPSVLKDSLDSFQKIRVSPYNIYGEKIYDKSRFMYQVGYRFLQVLSKLI